MAILACLVLCHTSKMVVLLITEAPDLTGADISYIIVSLEIELFKLIIMYSVD